MTPLCLDLGSITGWATRGVNGLVSGTWTNKPGRFDGGGMRYLRFRQWLGNMKGAGAFDVVYFEEVRNHTATDAAHVYGGLLAHLTAWCEEQAPKIPYQGVPVGTIKKHATGKGNASKDQMKAQAAKYLGRAPKDDNEADAVCLLFYCAEAFPDQRQPRVRVRTRIRVRTCDGQKTK